MTLPLFVLLAVQASLLGIFCFFAYYNYLYAIRSSGRWSPVEPNHSPPATHAKPRVAVVIAAYNEPNVLGVAVEAARELAYENAVVVLADDSDDERCLRASREFADRLGCERKEAHLAGEAVELHESARFVLLHRASNEGFKAGSLQCVLEYVENLAIDYIYLLDADWVPQQDALDRLILALERDPAAGFVQSRRISSVPYQTLFERYSSIIEEACYYVDFVGRQSVGHPILFSGCCALFRVSVLSAVGGFCAGHLTEDLDLSNRLWTQGYCGLYEPAVVNYGRSPLLFEHYRRQQARWAAGSGRVLREHSAGILRSSSLTAGQKLSAIRQNAYFFCAVATVGAIAVGTSTVIWLVLAEETFSAQWYLVMLDRWGLPLALVMGACLISSFVAPVLGVIRGGRWSALLHVPMSIWHAWAVLPTYAMASLRGLVGRAGPWHLTPKVLGEGERLTSPATVRLTSLVCLIVLASIYGLEGIRYEWFDFFALVLLPALYIGVRGGSQIGTVPPAS